MRRRPLVIAHRGASGYRPEHTLAAYALAIEQGADFIEPDLVTTRDGVLVARHESELSDTTDVAQRREFAGRRCRKRIDGEWKEGWFAEDFLLAELRVLRARERLPALRPANTAYDDQFEIPTLADIIGLVRQAEARGRRVGIYPETKHPTWFAKEGTHCDGEPIARSLGAMLVRELVALDFVAADRIFIQSFEMANLIELRRELMPAAGVDWPLVQLFGDFSRGVPYDLAWHLDRGDALADVYGNLPGETASRLRFADFASPAGLHWLAASHARAVGPSKDILLPHGPEGHLHPCLAQAQAEGLQVHPYTLRAEHRGEAYGKRLLAAGVDGFFIDQPDLGVSLRDHALAIL